MMRTKAQAYKAAKKVLEQLGNKNWQIIITESGATGYSYTYRLHFHKGLLVLHPHGDDSFFCLFTFDERNAGAGDPRFSENDPQFGKDPKALVERTIQKAQDVVDKEVYELNVINELMANPKRRQPW